MLFFGNSKNQENYHRYFLNCYPCSKNVFAYQLIPISITQGFEFNNDPDLSEETRIAHGGINFSAQLDHANIFPFRVYAAHNGHAYKDLDDRWNHHVIVIDFYRSTRGILYGTLYANLNPNSIPATIPDRTSESSIQVQAGDQLGMIDDKNIATPHLFFSILHWDTNGDCHMLDPFGIYKKDSYPTLGVSLDPHRHFWINSLPAFPG